MLPSEIIFIYGPPGAGKSSTGLILAEALDLAFHDLDQEIEQAAGKSIPDLFASKGESGFRELEKKRLDDLLRMGPAVIALGGGALLDPQARAQVERTGRVVCLGAALPTLLERLRSEPGSRPLIAAGEEQLAALLEQRRAHYASFPVQIFTDNLSPQQVTAEVQLGLGRLRVSGMGESYDVLIEAGSFKQIAAWLQCRGLHGPLAVVCDENVAALYGEGSLARPQGRRFQCRVNRITAWRGCKGDRIGCQAVGAVPGAGTGAAQHRDCSRRWCDQRSNRFRRGNLYPRRPMGDRANLSPRYG